MPFTRDRGIASLSRPVVPLLLFAAMTPASVKCAGAASPAEAAISFESIACVKPSATELSVARELAAARALLATTGGLFVEGWTIGAAAGPRRGEGSSRESDVVVEISAPLLARPDRRDRLASAVALAEEILPAVERLSRRYEGAAAYAEAWASERVVRLRERALEAVEQWLAAFRSRVAEGAAAPYEAELLVVERRAATTALAAARVARIAAWSALGARCELPPEPVALAPPAVETLVVGHAAAAAGGLLRNSIDLRAELALAGVDLEAARERSRWLVHGEMAQEGGEDVARLGFAYRLPRPGESAAIEARRDADAAALARDAELAKAVLRARIEAAEATLEAVRRDAATFGGDPGSSIAAIREALAALRREGRARISDILPLERQLLEAEFAEVERVAGLARAVAEIGLLHAEVAP